MFSDFERQKIRFSEKNASTSLKLRSTWPVEKFWWKKTFTDKLLQKIKMFSEFERKKCRVLLIFLRQNVKIATAFDVCKRKFWGTIFLVLKHFLGFQKLADCSRSFFSAGLLKLRSSCPGELFVAEWSVWKTVLEILNNFGLWGEKVWTFCFTKDVRTAFYNSRGNIWGKKSFIDFMDLFQFLLLIFDFHVIFLPCWQKFPGDVFITACYGCRWTFLWENVLLGGTFRIFWMFSDFEWENVGLLFWKPQ